MVKGNPHGYGGASPRGVKSNRDVAGWEARLKLTEMATPPAISMTKVTLEEARANVKAELDAARTELAQARAEIARLSEPQHRTLTGYEALMIINDMRPKCIWPLPYSTAESMGLRDNYF